MTSSEARSAGILAAAARNDVAALRELLRGGQAPDVRDGTGRTALFVAVEGGHADAAACLLAYGAKPEATDEAGRAALDPERTPLSMLHAIRQRYQRFEIYGEDKLSAYPAALRARADELAARGILKLPGFVKPEALAGMQRGLEAFAGEVDAMLARGEGIKRHYDEELHWCPKDQAYISNNAFRYSRELVEFCFSPELLALADLYLGKPSFLSRGVATRYRPVESPEKRAFAWHHDMEEKRLKVLVLLTDVGETDQHMSYVAGSHAAYHPYEMFLENAYTLEVCRELLGGVEVVHTTGRAGDVFLFDSNGAHRGVRRAGGAVRDAYFVEFATNIDQVWGSDLDRDHIDSLAAKAGVNPFQQMLTAPKKWERTVQRTVTGWIESLPRLRAWL